VPSAKDVGDAIKGTVKSAYKYRNVGSAALAYFGWGPVAGFLASDQLGGFVDDYGIPVERVWDAMFDTKATRDGAPMDFSERTLRAIADYVVEEDIDISPKASWLFALGDYVIRNNIPIDPSIAGLISSGGGAFFQTEGAESTLPEFLPSDDGGELRTPEGFRLKEEQVVCARSPDLAGMIGASKKGKAKETTSSGAGAFMLGVAVTLGVSFVLRRVRG